MGTVQREDAAQTQLGFEDDVLTAVRQHEIHAFLPHEVGHFAQVDVEQVETAFGDGAREVRRNVRPLASRILCALIGEHCNAHGPWSISRLCRTVGQQHKQRSNERSRECLR